MELIRSEKLSCGVGVLVVMVFSMFTLATISLKLEPLASHLVGQHRFVNTHVEIRRGQTARVWKLPKVELIPFIAAREINQALNSLIARSSSSLFYTVRESKISFFNFISAATATY